MLKFLTDRKFAVVILTAVLVGLIYSLTPLMVWKHFHDSGERFVLAQFKTYRDSLYTYLPRAREIYDGHFPPGEIFASKQAPTVQNFLPTLLFSAFIFLFRGNMNLAYLGAQFFFSGIIFIILYLLGWILWRSRPWAIFLGLVGTLTPIVTKLPFIKWHGLSEFMAFFVNNFIPLVKTEFDQLYLARIDEPLLTYPIYFLAILAFFIFWQKPSRWRAIFAGAAAGLIFYTYFHHWVYWVVVLGILFLYVLFFARKNKALFRNYLILLAALCLVAAPYFINYLRFSGSVAAQDFVYREGVTYGRSLGIAAENLADYAVYLGLAIATYFLYWKNNRGKAVLFFGLILAMAVVWNVQLVVGYSPVPQFYRRSISPVIFIILFDFIYTLAQKVEISKPGLKKTAAAILAILSLFVVVKKVVNIAEIEHKIQPALLDYYNFPSEVARSWDWINADLGKEPTVLSPSTMTSLYLATYTSARPFLPTAFATLLPMREIEDRYLLAHKIFGVTEETLRQRLAGKVPADCEGYQCFPDKMSNLNDSFGHIYGNYFPSRYLNFHDFVFGGNGDLIAEKRAEKIDELLARYRQLKIDWKSLEADYVYVGPMEKQIGIADPSHSKNLKLVYQNSLVEIYQVQR